MNKTIVFILILISIHKNVIAVVMRHDTPKDEYAVLKFPDYLIDMPHEGHGVLISSNWIISVAHTIFYNYEGKTITIGNKNYTIEKVVIHPDYLVQDETLSSGDAKSLMSFYKSRSDIALIKLSTDIENLSPIKLYDKKSEQGKLITVFGRGATGNGITGEIFDSNSNRVLNLFNNKIEETKDKWLTYTFDPPRNAVKLEGIHGSRDSGGPSIIYIKDIPYLVGLSSWQYWGGPLSLFKGGLYGAVAYQVRVSSYILWIRSVINEN